MENFVCINCKYKFSARTKPSLCPYCNKSSIEKEKSAEDLLNEIDALVN